MYIDSLALCHRLNTFPGVQIPAGVLLPVSFISHVHSESSMISSLSVFKVGQNVKIVSKQYMIRI